MHFVLDLLAYEIGIARLHQLFLDKILLGIDKKSLFVSLFSNNVTKDELYN